METEAVVSAPFFLRGELVEGSDVIQRSRDLGVTFATPAIPFDRLVPPRTEVPPLLNVPLSGDHRFPRPDRREDSRSQE